MAYIGDDTTDLINPSLALFQRYVDNVLICQIITNHDISYHIDFSRFSVFSMENIQTANIATGVTVAIIIIVVILLSLYVYVR